MTMRPLILIASLLLASCVSDPVATKRDRANYDATKIIVDKWFAGEPPPVPVDQDITRRWLGDWDSRLKTEEKR